MSLQIEVPNPARTRRPGTLVCECGTEYQPTQPGCSLDQCAECRIEHEAIAWSIRDLEAGLAPQVYDHCFCGERAVSWSPVHQDGPLCATHLVDRIGPGARLN